MSLQASQAVYAQAMFRCGQIKKGMEGMNCECGVDFFLNALD